jgi:hypothetical protein
MPSQRLGRLTLSTLAAALLIPGAVLAQDAEPDPLPAQGTILEPGRYVSRAAGPVVDFRVEAGWIVGPGDNGPIFTLEYLDAPGTVLSVTRFDGETYLDSCDPTSMSLVEASVPRLTEIIAGNPFLNAGSPDVIEIDGHTGLWFDVGVPAYTPDECASSYPYVLLWAIPVGDGGPFVQVADQQSRFIVLDVNGDVIVIAIESTPGVPFGGFLEASMDLVESMNITPGEYLPLPTPAAGDTVPVETTEPEPSSTAEVASV